MPIKMRRAAKILTFFFLHFFRFFARNTSFAIASFVLWWFAAMDLILDMSCPVFPDNPLHEAFWSQTVLIMMCTTLVCTLAHAGHIALGLHSIASLGIDVFGAVLPIFLPFVFEITRSSRRTRFFFLLETV